ncbi:glutamate receptor ionotropic, kainate 4 isoform X1 [Lates japonicus]|uniref:Glutamate receptor ionotropic, kainate 4 isoform X1 n=1 Tax=Lates japonicus TaxID=270547 RepID=A0AAD3R7I8_LATJO|nr:glutamate receptor ionotropic, kainate 4 isoform X1 [Lates japonicus]
MDTDYGPQAARVNIVTTTENASTAVPSTSWSASTAFVLWLPSLPKFTATLLIACPSLRQDDRAVVKRLASVNRVSPIRRNRPENARRMNSTAILDDPMECSRGERLAITLAKDSINRNTNRSTTGKLEVDIFELLRDSEYEMGETMCQIIPKGEGSPRLPQLRPTPSSAISVERTGVYVTQLACGCAAHVKQPVTTAPPKYSWKQ